MLLWRKVKGRPVLKASSCRHRLQQLSKHEAAGPLMAKIREVAGGWGLWGVQGGWDCRECGVGVKVGVGVEVVGWVLWAVGVCREASDCLGSAFGQVVLGCGVEEKVGVKT